MRQAIQNFLNSYLGDWYMPDVKVTDIIEIIIIAFLVYQVIVWIKNTKAWMLMKGIVVLAVFILLAAAFKMNTILWLAKNSISVLATAAVIVFQPELRRALEKLGQKNFLTNIVSFDKNKYFERFNEKTIDAVVNACYEMGKVKTGALIVVERDILLTEYQQTGIALDSLVSEQILVNIFEHNTPLHDGAVILRGDRIVAATCYLPLSENMGLSKQLGTRHRAAVGMSEVSDAFVICVSEETGNVSYAVGGHITRAVPKEELREQLIQLQGKTEKDNKIFTLKKGRRGNERQAEK
jgi:diadenylate cyclase